MLYLFIFLFGEKIVSIFLLNFLFVKRTRVGEILITSLFPYFFLFLIFLLLFFYNY